jgi:hypothetical protein
MDGEQCQQRVGLHEQRVGLKAAVMLHPVSINGS